MEHIKKIPKIFFVICEGGKIKNQQKCADFRIYLKKKNQWTPIPARHTYLKGVYKN